MKLSGWRLQQEFILLQMDRLDHPHYFNKDFACPDIDSYFANTLTTNQKIWESRKLLNQFFDRMLSLTPRPAYKSHEPESAQRWIYIKIKWLVYLHHLMQDQFDKRILLYNVSLKGLLYCMEQLNSLVNISGPFESYLVKNVMRPYLQYLSKVCMLKQTERLSWKISSGESDQALNKENNDANSLLSTDRSQDNTTAQFGCQEKQQQVISQNDEQQESKVQKVPMQLINKWFQTYNLILQVTGSMTVPLRETMSFFTRQFPYLSNIHGLIAKDLERYRQTLKADYEIISNILNINSLEVRDLFDKIDQFNNKTKGPIQQSHEDDHFEDEPLQKNDVKDFMVSPLKAKHIDELQWGSSIKKPMNLQPNFD